MIGKVTSRQCVPQSHNSGESAVCVELTPYKWNIKGIKLRRLYIERNNSPVLSYLTLAKIEHYKRSQEFSGALQRTNHFTSILRDGSVSIISSRAKNGYIAHSVEINAAKELTSEIQMFA